MVRRYRQGERFLETYLAADVATCERRDPKGLYAKARSGEIAEFTGVTAPYQPPATPDLVLETGQRGVDECVTRLLGAIAERFV
jgi:adenylylsulfate kinase-like enzyme